MNTLLLAMYVSTSIVTIILLMIEWNLRKENFIRSCFFMKYAAIVGIFSIIFGILVIINIIINSINS